MKKEKNKQKYKTLIVIAAVLLIIVIVSSATFAYWRWETATGQQTNVNVQVKGGTLTINGDNVTNTGVTLYPISLANCASNALVGTATVTAVNETETNMTVTPMLKATLEVNQGSLSASAKEYLRWAVVETNSSFAPLTPGETCANATYTGNFANVMTNHHSGSLTVSTVNTGTSFAITTAITPENVNELDTVSVLRWTANGTSTSGTSESSGVTTTKYYKVYVWLDSGYEYTNVGTDVSDPMQNLKITMTWSQNSEMAQNANS